MRPTTPRTEREVEAFEVTTPLNVGVLEDYTSYGDKIRVVELPYSDEQFSMFIFKSGNWAVPSAQLPPPSPYLPPRTVDRQHCFSDFQSHQTVNSIRGLTTRTRHRLPLALPITYSHVQRTTAPSEILLFNTIFRHTRELGINCKNWIEK